LPSNEERPEIVEQVGFKGDEEKEESVEDSGPGRLDRENRHYLCEPEPDLDEYQEIEPEPGYSPVEFACVRGLVADEAEGAYREG
jgi:hypothetical protein